MLTRISPQEMSVERFQHSLFQACGAFQAETTAQRDTINGAVRTEERAGFEIAHVATDLQAVRRTKRDIRRDAGEHFFLIVQEEGRALMSQRETARFLVPGDMILIDSAEPSEFSFFGSFGRQLSIHLPRDEMVQRFGHSLSGGLYLPRTDYVTMAIGATLAKAFEPLGNEDQSQSLREAMFGLIGALLFERNDHENARDIEAEVSSSDLLQRGIAYLDRFFQNSDLTISSMAEELGVSDRKLQRAFALVGTTPSDYLLQKRLEYACQLLLERRNGTRGTLVSTIAYASGFNDVSYFNRQFRKKLNCSPGQYGD